MTVENKLKIYKRTKFIFEIGIVVRGSSDLSKMVTSVILALYERLLCQSLEFRVVVTPVSVLSRTTVRRGLIYCNSMT